MVRSFYPSRLANAALSFAFATALASAVLSARPAAADLAVKGGEAAQQEQIRSIFDQLIPAVWKSDAVVPVSVLSDQDMHIYIVNGSGGQSADSDDDDDTIDGIYEDGPSRITLRGSTESEDMPFTFAHEYGHYVWKTFLTKADRGRYSQIYKHDLKSHHLVTDYAETNLDEGFAEAFSYYVVDKRQLTKADPDSAQFLDDVRTRMTQQAHLKSSVAMTDQPEPTCLPITR